MNAIMNAVATAPSAKRNRHADEHRHERRGGVEEPDRQDRHAGAPSPQLGNDLQQQLQAEQNVMPAVMSE